MRAGVVWAALALLAVCCAQRRDSQVDSIRRNSRRLPMAPAIDGNSFTAAEPSNASPTFRPRGGRREEITRDTVRTKSRSRTPERTQPALETERIVPQPSKEPFQSRRTRTRRPVEIKTEATFTSRDGDRSRSRQTVRRKPLSTTQPTVEATSPTIDQTKIEVINTNIDEISKLTAKQENTANTTTTQFRRRSSIAQTTETVSPRRGRGRVNTRPNARSLDLDDSGTTNSVVIVDKAPTTARTAADLRNSRKLRYKTRPSETDTNLTGEGIVTINEVKSSQKESPASQPETKENKSDSVVADTIMQQSTEANKIKTTTLKVTKVVRRPLARGKIPKPVAHAKPKSDELEISDDDNYPESFKALIQAKNATQTNSSNSESLSVKASQKVYKTYNTSLQSTQTGPAVNKYSRLRKQKPDVDNQDNQDQNTETTEASASKASVYKPRGKYSARNKKSSLAPSSTTANSVVGSSSERPSYKYSRMFKYTSTTQAPKQNNSENIKKDEVDAPLKKSLIRPSLYSKKLSGRNIVSSTEVSMTEIGTKTEHSVKSKVSLPRKSYYSRLRNKNGTTTTSTTTTSTERIEEISSEVAQKKTEDSDMPLIFTLFKEPDHNALISESLTKHTENEEPKNKEPFIIAVSSTESGESMTGNEVDTSEQEKTSIVVASPPNNVKEGDKHRYHSNYKNENPTAVDSSHASSTTSLPVRNLQSRKYGRTRSRQDKIEESPVSTTPRSRDRQVKKYSEAFLKPTEATNNGITPEPEKSKSRYSSKYRASYLDKPFYKPTVPSITSSTAWLKFFVTDNLLTKSVEGPNWFEGKDLDVTTESLSKPAGTASYHHDTYDPSNIELVEGEEIQLGPDLNAIAITQTRRTLSSADLRLESLAKPSQVMNVEASHHSPSVTVSIFDALAEILTSTPKPRLSTTTEVTTKSLNTDVTQILNGVSNIVNVDSSGGIPSPETFVSADGNSSTISVQSTQTTPIVINNMSAGEVGSTEIVTSVNTPTTPIPTPSTPVSARKPFAFKILYSETESPPTVKLSTAPDTSNQPTTDNPATVYNTVSDLLLSNNNVVSLGLTSMLTNNIKDIIQNMDEDSRAKISSDMAKILQSLIPRAVDGLQTGLDNADFTPNTTPYSLEAIEDTANIDFGVNSNDNLTNSSQNDSNVNSVIKDDNILSDVSNNTTPIVNSLGSTPRTTQSLTSTTATQTTSAKTLIVTESSFEQPLLFLPSTTAASNVDTLTSFVPPTVDISNVNNEGTGRSPTNNRALPFLTNFRFNDFTSTDEENSGQATKPIPSTLTSVAPKEKDINFDVQNPTQVSPLQLWVLTKKAKVLQMIEELLKQHNSEIATAPTFIDMISPSSENIQLSRRLTDIMNTMTFTTDSTTTTKDKLTSPLTTSFPILMKTDPNTPQLSDITTSLDPMEISTSLPMQFDTRENIETTTAADTTDFLSRLGSETSSTTKTIDYIFATTISTINTEQPQETVTEQSSTTVGNTETVTLKLQEITETTTAAANTETTTEINIGTSTQVDETDATTQSNTDDTTVNINSSNNTPLAVLSAATPAPIPKKDYVIFGILPNNTVVRKDPNDDVLESLTEASPYIVYGLLPNNTVIRKFPNGTRVPRIMQKIDILPISPWNLRNPYSPIHNIPAIVRPRSNPIRVSTNTVTSTDFTNNGTESRLTTDTISTSALNIKSSSLGITTATKKPPAELSTASHVLSLRTTTMLPSIDEILLNSISSAAKQELVISSMTSSTHEPRILTLDIDPETQQIRTEKPTGDRDGKVFKFIPIDEIMVQTQKSNVLKLGTKAPSTTSTTAEVQIMTDVTEGNAAQASTTETQMIGSMTETTVSTVANTPVSTTVTMTPTTEATTTTSEAATTSTTAMPTTSTTVVTMTTVAPTTTETPTTPVPTTLAPLTTTQASPLTTQSFTTLASTTVDSRTTILTTNFDDEIRKYQADSDIIQSLQNARDPKQLNLQTGANSLLTGAASGTTTRIVPSTTQANDAEALLQALLAATKQNPNTLTIPNFGGNIQVTAQPPTTTTSRSIEDDIRQFEEDTKLLKALLQATGQNPANLNIPSLDSILTTTRAPTTTQSTTTTQRTTTPRPTTTVRQQTTTQSIEQDLKQFQEDAKLLQALLQATGQNPTNLNLPVISGITSNVRVASNPRTTSIGSNPTTPLNVRPVFSTTQSGPVFQTIAPRLSTTLQPVQSTTEDVRISTTFPPFNRREQTTTSATVTLSGRRAPGRFTTTTEIPSTSTFSVEEDLLFLQNLKTVLNTNPNPEDPEAVLANRIIALAVDRSLNEIKSGVSNDAVRTGKNINNGANNLIPTTTTTVRPTTTTQATTTTQRPTTTTQRPFTTTQRPFTTTQRPLTTTGLSGGPSIEDDIKQFQEDTKLLQALIKATGQDPSKFNIPTLPSIVTSTVSSKPSVNDDLKLISKLLAQAPHDKQFDSLTPKPTMISTVTMTDTTTPRPFGARIVVKDDLKTVQDDGKLLKTLIKLQGAQETTTMRSKLAITGQTSDEALKKLLQQQRGTMVSEATKAPISLSTEYGKSNDALLAALLKEQGFGPTTASSLDEQLRLAALLNQVVVTPKTRRTTTPPPPPAPRRPILDGLAWLWQQWRETGPGPAPGAPARRPQRPEATTARANWFGSGPFVGNADDRPGNRIPLEPPSAATGAGRGQLVSAAINVTRAFSQFLGAAIQGAAQTVQSVIRAGTRAAGDVYTNGSAG